MAGEQIQSCHSQPPPADEMVPWIHSLSASPSQWMVAWGETQMLQGPGRQLGQIEMVSTRAGSS